MSGWHVLPVIAGGVLIEAVRRRDVYVIIMVAFLAGVGLASIDFFNIEGLVKFYHEVTLKLMSIATAIAVLLLAVRQLPREFENRTIYPLMARPVSRSMFLLGKGLGVVLAGMVCLALSTVLYMGGTFWQGGDVHLGLFLQHLYLQLLLLPVLVAGGFLLSLVVHSDAAIVLALLLYLTSGVVGNASTMLYDLTTAFGRACIVGLTILIPQFYLFDLSEKTLHGELWEPLPILPLLVLAGYALFYTTVYGLCAYFCFRRRALT